MIKKIKSLISGKKYQPVMLSLIGIIVILAISIPLAQRFSRQYKMGQEIANLQEEISGVKNKNSELSNLIQYLQSDQFASEQARLKLNYKKEGEEVVVIKGIDGQPATTTVSSLNINYGLIPDKIAEKNNNFNKWWNYFFVK